MAQRFDLPNSKNLWILCLAKAIRTLAFGAISVILALFLLERGFTTAEVGALFSATLLEDALITVMAARLCSRFGMRVILFLSCALIVCGGIVLAISEAKWILAIAVVCGIVSPAGYEGGPFAALEQTIISQASDKLRMTRAFSLYNLVGFAGAAVGALIAGLLVTMMKPAPTIQAYQGIFLLYSCGGVVLALLYALVQVQQFDRASDAQRLPSLSNRISDKSDVESRRLINRLAALLSIDALGGGFIVQSFLTLWFFQRYHVDATFLGPVYFWCNVIAALSFLFAPYVVRKLGLLNTMVVTHLPCSLALCLMPFLPSAGMAAGLLLLRSAFSSMDIPVRQTFTMLIVPEQQRAFAAGMTTSARAIAQGIAPSITGVLMQSVASGTPLILAGVLKSIYDLSLYYSFKNVPLADDRSPSTTLNISHDADVAGQRRSSQEVETRSVSHGR